jgi:hypothetical protein
MTPLSIIEHFEMFKDQRSPAWLPPVTDTGDDGLIPVSTFRRSSRHKRCPSSCLGETCSHHACCLQVLLVGRRRILTATIGMVEQARPRLTAVERHLQVANQLNRQFAVAAPQSSVGWI